MSNKDNLLDLNQMIDQACFRMQEGHLKAHMHQSFTWEHSALTY